MIQEEAFSYYNNLGLNEYYFQTASPSMIANNLNCVIATKIMNKFSGDAGYFPEIKHQSSDEVFCMAKASLNDRKNSQNYQTERSIEDEYLGFDGSMPPWRLQGYRSVGSIFDDPSRIMERLRTYFLQKPHYPIPPSQIESNEIDLSKIMDVPFYAHKKGTGTERIFEALNRMVVDDHTGLGLFIMESPRLDGRVYRVDIAFRRFPANKKWFSTIGDTIAMYGLYSQRKYVEPLSNGVTIATTFVMEVPRAQSNRPNETFPQKVLNMTKALKMQYIMPRSKFMELAQDRFLTVHQSAFACACAMWISHFSSTVGPTFAKIADVLEGSPAVSPLELYQLKTKLKVSSFSEDFICQMVIRYPHIVRRLYSEFQRMHHPRLNKGPPPQWSPQAEALPTEEDETDVSLEGPRHPEHPLTTSPEYLQEWVEDTELSRDIERLDFPLATETFKLFRTMNKHILVTNFWKADKLALSFRLDPSFLPEVDFSRRPHAIVFSVGQEYTGFHVRFAEVARGGLRVVQSFSHQAYEHNRQRAFDENYNLSLTQNFKNKDIPEGGSKGVILLDYTETPEEAAVKTPKAYKRYIDSFLDLLLPDERIVNRWLKEEVCFIGPDEHTGTGCLMDWAADHAKLRGAWFWKAFTTGKQPKMGGIPHDTFGMTTTSVQTFIKGVLSKMGVDEASITKCQTGGPDGDLGCNSLLSSEARLTSLIDGSGVVSDPDGLNREELKRLAHRRFEGLPTSAMHFDASLLGPKGFRVSVTDTDSKLPDGTTVPSGIRFRNEFHLSPLARADLFNPCGGRPESITPFNVDSLFDSKGEPHFKYICEGANLFITEDARRTLEKRGVVLFKDASANKGGVTSSSLEVLAALALDDDVFNTHMMVSDVASPPKFYSEYVKEVKEKIVTNAQLEFEALWREGVRTGKPRCELTDLLSQRIIDLKTQINISDSNVLWNDKQLKEIVILSAVPAVLSPGLIPFNALIERVPEPYLKAIFASTLASRFYYTHGVDANPFGFLEYVDKVRSSEVDLNDVPPK
eukprot:GHVN01053541.1.p1 GENE.GHVN01053541.1~~GHVN01053541.1.p1  ORF type:complete len:1028 (+),score=161.33 GHVN01053541.1:638-3721(+)